MRRMRWLLALLVLGAAWTSGERPASAQWGGGSCTISTTPVSFGSYNVFNSSALPSTGTIRFRCTDLWWSNLTVYLSKGSAPNNNPRQMVKGADRINYNLYLDAAHTQVWGDPNPYSYGAFYGWWNSNPDVTLTVYGLIPALQDVTTGSYSDSVTATVNF
jgi:spore coat protein U-like protein